MYCEVEAYCNPMRDAVKRAMRMLSDEPLIFGVPVHCAIEGIVPHTLQTLCTDNVACAMFSS
jgi:hypothetical protein